MADPEAPSPDATAWSSLRRAAPLAFAGLCLLPFSQRTEPVDLALSLVLAGTLATLAIVDIDRFRLPDALTLPLIAAGIALVPPATTTDALERAVAAALGYLLLYAVARGYRALRGHAGLGLGDAKLFAAAGAWVSFAGLSSVLFVASVSALIVVAARRWNGDALDPEQAIAFGPYLAAGFWLTWLFGGLI